MTRAFSLCFIVLMFVGCTTQPLTEDHLTSPVANSLYEPFVEKYTASKKAYQGFYNTFQASLTLQSTELSGLMLQRQAHFLQWDEEVLRQEREKMFQESSSYSKAFLAFFSPENDYDDLNDPDSIWKIYLVHQGVRYPGQVKKDQRKYVELKELYPHLDRFSTPYSVTFNVPMTAIEKDPIKIVLTSSLGSAEFEF